MKPHGLRDAINGAALARQEKAAASQLAGFGDPPKELTPALEQALGAFVRVDADRDDSVLPAGARAACPGRSARDCEGPSWNECVRANEPGSGQWVFRREELRWTRWPASSRKTVSRGSLAPIFCSKRTSDACALHIKRRKISRLFTEARYCKFSASDTSRCHASTTDEDKNQIEQGAEHRRADKERELGFHRRDHRLGRVEEIRAGPQNLLAEPGQHEAPYARARDRRDARNARTGISSTPAGIEIKCRITGRRRARKIPGLP